MLTPWRRHLTGTSADGKPLCPHASKGRAYTKCNCPIWADGKLDGKRYRQPVRTPGGGTVTDWQRAIRLLAALEDPDAPRCKPIAEAVADFEKANADLAPATNAKYRVTLKALKDHCEKEALEDLSEISVEHLDAFRAGRELGPLSSLKELQRLRHFFGFCVERDWIRKNPAKRIKAPRNLKPPEVVPYEPQEVTKMLAACEKIGKAPYERLRARALVLLLRYTGLRITDAITLARDRIHDGQILLYTQKTGGTVFLPIPAVLQDALDALPEPRGTVGPSRHYFWNGTMSKRATKGTAERTLARVFALSEVAGAHAHRFRHTLATDILVRGGTEQDVADILGISAAIVRKHYAKWSQARQQRITNLMSAVFPGTFLARGAKQKSGRQQISGIQ